MASDPLSDAQRQIVAKAEAVRIAADGNPYLYGGNTTAGFDCSGFVIYVFNQAYGLNTLARVTADDLRTSGRFRVVTDPQPADLVFFSQNPRGTRAHHVGIVIDASRWIGSQSSTGVAYVDFANSYWRPRILSYGRYVPMVQAGSIIPMTAGQFASVIR
jgi:cell wall-associated NlpC family hydrolase